MSLSSIPIGTTAAPCPWKVSAGVIGPGMLNDDAVDGVRTNSSSVNISDDDVERSCPLWFWLWLVKGIRTSSFCPPPPALPLALVPTLALDPDLDLDRIFEPAWAIELLLGVQEVGGAIPPVGVFALRWVRAP